MLLVLFLFSTTLHQFLALPTTIEPDFGLELPETALKALEAIQEIKLKHLESDKGFQAAIKYFKSPEWEQIVEDIRATPEWTDYKNFLKEAGFDLDPFIAHLEHCLNATDTDQFDVTGVEPSLVSFLDDVKTSQGVTLMQVLNELLQKIGQDKDQGDTLELISGEQSKVLLEKVLASANVKKAVEKLNEMGLPLQVVLQFIYGLTGWKWA